MAPSTRFFGQPIFDRVREHTPPKINERIDRRALSNVRYYARRPKYLISAAIEELDREWDIERLLETSAAVLAFGGTALGLIGSKKWLLLPAIVTGFLFNYATRGWCPPVPLFRRLNVRTRKEIDAEKFALKALRGDFDVLCGGSDRTLLAEHLMQVAMST